MAPAYSVPVDAWWYRVQLESWLWFTKADERRTIFSVCAGLLIQFLPAAGILLSCVVAPYGRYNSGEEAEKKKVGAARILVHCDVNPKLAWFLQEVPVLIAAGLCWARASPECANSLGNRLVLGALTAHYVNRSIIYPLRMKGSKPTPLPLVFFAGGFCTANGYIQCRSLTQYLLIDASTPLTVVGLGLWGLGLYINYDSDGILRNLRKPGETGYKIPRGGMFDYVSGANYFGEILEWIGYAIAMGGALPGVTFAVCTACNIGPRAIAHHKWYLEKFGDEYPRERKAIIPFVI